MLRGAYVALGIADGEWVKDIDVTGLASGAEEHQKLLATIVVSLYIRAEGSHGAARMRPIFTA